MAGGLEVRRPRVVYQLFWNLSYCIMANHFQGKLISGHSILSAQKSDLLSTMQRHPLLTPTFQHTGSVGVYREFCAALLWLDSPVYSLTAIKQLPVATRITLCTMLGIVATPSAIDAQSKRIFQYCATKRATAAPGGGATAPPVGGPAGGTSAGGGGAARASAAPALAYAAPAPAIGGAGGASLGGGARRRRRRSRHWNWNGRRRAWRGFGRRRSSVRPGGQSARP